MDGYIGISAHASSYTLAVVGPSGRKLSQQVVETHASALVEAVRSIPKPRHLRLEEGTHSAWLHEILSPHVDELVVVSVGHGKAPKNDLEIEATLPFVAGSGRGEQRDVGPVGADRGLLRRGTRRACATPRRSGREPHVASSTC